MSPTVILQYIGIVFLAVLAVVGSCYQARQFFSKERREAKLGSYSEFNSTIQLLKDKVDVQQSQIEELTAKVKTLEERNTCLVNEISLHNERANHYLALFATRCPYEEIREGKGVCEFFHPIDKEHIREKILARLAEETEDID